MSLRCFTFLVAAIVLANSSGSSSCGQTVAALSDIDYWVGSGSQEAALAIDWNGQSTSDAAYVWGYRWEGAANAADMLIDVVSTDRRLYAKLGAIAGLGTATVGLGYDQNNDQRFELTDDTTFDQYGISSSGFSDGETSLDPADYYSEGWFLGFWHIGFAADNPFDGGSFSSASVGIDGVVLSDDAWLSLAFTTDTFSTSAFVANLVAATAPFSADFDSDDDSDGQDFLAWQRGFGTLADASLEQGDANGDQRVDQRDLQLWTAAFGSASTLSISTLNAAILSGAIHNTARAIPEPGTTAQLLGAAFVAAMLKFLDINRPRKTSLS